MEAKLAVRICAAILGLSVATSALAHHGWAGQGTEDFTLKGKVSKALSLSGPHATMQITDEKGQGWDLTLAPPTRTEAAGSKEGLIVLAEDVSMLGKRNLDPT